MDHYEILIKGHIGSHWEQWFEGMSIKQLPSGKTILFGPIIDQAALHGILSRIRDLGLPLLEVKRKELKGTGRTGEN